jgi:hypothetical protein
MLCFLLLIPSTSTNQFAYDVHSLSRLFFDCQNTFWFPSLCIIRIWVRFLILPDPQRIIWLLSTSKTSTFPLVFNFSLSYNWTVSDCLNNHWNILNWWGWFLVFFPQIYWFWYPQCPIRIVSSDAHISYWTRSSTGFSSTRIYLWSSRNCTLWIFLIHFKDSSIETLAFLCL